MLTLTLSLILDELKEELIRKFKESKDEIKYLIDDGLQEYILNQHTKLKKVKTFLYRSEPVDFYETFFPPVLNGTSAGGISYSICMETEVDTLFEKSRYISIIGEAGSGKTILMKHLFLYFLRKRQEIPIYIELRNLNLFEGNFHGYIQQLIFNNRLSPNSKILERLLSTGKFLFLLDGYDELQTCNKSARIDQINQFIDKYRKNHFLFTSRPGASLESFPRFYNYTIAPLQDKQIEPFVRKQLTNMHEGELWISRIMQILQDPENDDYIDSMTNPLLLSMFIFTFKNHPEMPKKKSKFYFNIFDTLCTRHDAFNKSGELHERKTHLKSEDFEQILQLFGYISYWESKYTFDRAYLIEKLNDIKKEKGYNADIEDLIYDLTVAVPVFLQDGICYHFTHRTFQEYFMALFISRQPESVKLKIYHTIYLDYNDESFLLWKLSEELDTYCFKKFLLILMQYLTNKVFNAPSGKQNILFFLHVAVEWGWISKKKILLRFKNCLPYIFLGKINHFNMYLPLTKSMMKIIIKKKEIKKFISYHNENKMGSPPLSFMRGEKHILVEPKEYMIRFHEEINEYLFPYYEESGLVKEIEKILADMKSKTIHLQMELEQMENMHYGLLNI